MTKKSTVGLGALCCLVTLAATSAFSFHGGHTGVSEEQIKAACPAFRSGHVELFDTVAPPGNLPMTDVFAHESGARCACTRMRTDGRGLRCGPMSALPPKAVNAPSVSAPSRPAQP